MKKFSEIGETFHETGRDATIKRVASLTGLPVDGVTKIYESMKLDNLSDSAVVEHFERAAKPKNSVTCGAFFGSLTAGLSGVEGSMTDVQKTGITHGILAALSDFASGEGENVMEPAELLATVKGLVEMKNPAAKGLLSAKKGEALEIAPVSHDWDKLNEAMQTGPEDTVQLYEGLRRILAKNTRRWGNAYRLQNSYEEIMRFVDEDAKRIQLEAQIVSVDDGFHLNLLDDLLSGNVNPIYKHINGVRQLIPDMQGLLFDMVVLVNVFMQQNEYAMQYLSRINVNEYNTAARNLLASVASSRRTSRILAKELRDADAGKPMPETDGISPYPLGYGFGKNFLQDCTNGVDGSRLQHSTWNMPLKSVVDMLNLCKSMSTDFNMKIRPLIRDYVTKSYGITGRIERAKREVAAFKI